MGPSIDEGEVASLTSVGRRTAGSGWETLASDDAKELCYQWKGKVFVNKNGKGKKK